MRKNKWPIEKYHLNSDDNPCRCFQVTRRIHYVGEEHYRKSTVFLPLEQNTLSYLYFTAANYTMWDEYIAVWKIKSLNKPAGAAKELNNGQ
jgi:hypothetical protein